MRKQKKTDNKQIDMKLELREQVLRRAGVKACRVLDLFAGRGEIWTAMRSRIKVVRYVPCDKTPRMPGTIRGDSTDERFLAAFDMRNFNVVDIDTYGEPWRPYRLLAERVVHPTVFFLTHGEVSGLGGCNTSAFVLETLGIPKNWPIPQKIGLARYAARIMTSKPLSNVRLAWGNRVSVSNVNYLGILIERKEEATDG